MIRVGRYLLVLLLFSFGTTSAFAAAESRVPPQVRAYYKKVRMKCEEGIGQACSEYAAHLEESPNPAEKKKPAHFLRRACLMMYQPACAPRPEEAQAPVAAGKGKAGDVSDCFNPTNFQEAVRFQSIEGGTKILAVKTGGVWSKFGFKAGDELLSSDGKKLNSPTDITRSAPKGSSVSARVLRGGQEITIPVKVCP